MSNSLLSLGEPGQWAKTYDISLHHRRGPLDLALEFTLQPGWTALFAPSGAGKTTVLRLIAGLERPDRGHVILRIHAPQIAPGEIPLFEAESKIDVPTHQRRIQMVPQHPALFPHLSVVQNIGYSTPRTARDRQKPLDELLSLCRIAHLRDQMPAQLSGGERQRVALARALRSPGRLLLLDEPFTGLEADLRDELIQELRAYLAAVPIPVLLVTHDLGEVFAAQAHVLKMANGRIAASGPAHEVLAQERTRLLQRLNPPLSV